MVQVVKFPTGSQCIHNPTPDPENQSNKQPSLAPILILIPVLFKPRTYDINKVNKSAPYVPYVTYSGGLPGFSQEFSTTYYITGN